MPHRVLLFDPSKGPDADFMIRPVEEIEFDDEDGAVARLRSEMIEHGPSRVDFEPDWRLARDLPDYLRMLCIMSALYDNYGGDGDWHGAPATNLDIWRERGVRTAEDLAKYYAIRDYELTCRDLYRIDPPQNFTMDSPIFEIEGALASI